MATFEDELPDPQGWEKFNRGYIRENHRGFLEFFFGELFPEPHSSKQIEDAVAYGLDGPVEALLMDQDLNTEDPDEIADICRQVRCPMVVVQGDRDNCQPFERGLRLAELAQAEHVTMRGVGHLPNCRHPVPVNQLIHEFASRFEPRSESRRTWSPPWMRPRRALLLSSPIGLGHAWRDVAIARELRQVVPGLEIQWLAQPPVTTLLEACGETVHPASAQLAPEAAHVDAESRGHELHAFQMLRRLDEIFCANFMVFHDLVREEPFDVWIADEAWEVDYFLHENPELKTAPYVWLTDFVGILPMPAGGEYEAFLAADYNGEMVEHVARHPHLRDRSIFIGEVEDIVPECLGPDLPTISDWTREHFEFAGYITGFETEDISDRDALRAEFGYRDDEKVCLVSAGGSRVGLPLLQEAIAALPHARAEIPELRMIVVAGPRIDAESLPQHDGLEVMGYVHKLYRQLAACDVAISHGGLSTTMELTAAERPFLYFPLRNHFEQNIHVHHRLRRHRAGRRMEFSDSPPEVIAQAIVEALDGPPDHAPVPTDGAARAASLIAEVL
jgi:UDP:flavonoid glycosyltransferase YjiC (YdhE family)